MTLDRHNTFCQEMFSLESSQEQTDNYVILYCVYAKERGCKSIHVWSLGSDIFFTLLYHARFLEGFQFLERATHHTGINETKLAMFSMSVLHYWVIMPSSGATVSVPSKGRGKRRDWMSLKQINHSRKHSPS